MILHYCYLSLLLYTTVLILLQVLCGNAEESSTLTARFESNYDYLQPSRFAKREQQRDNQDPLQKFTKSSYAFPGRLAVEFSGSTDLNSDVEALINHLKSKFNGTDMSVKNVFDHPFMRATSIQVKSDHGEKQDNELYGKIAMTATAFTGVSNVYPIRAIPRPNAAHGSFMENDDNDTHVKHVELLSPHVQTQVDQVHQKLNLTGRGIVIGVIDDGIDYNHPALGGGFGEGYKVRYGRDLVGDDYDFSEDSVPSPDNDPIDSCSKTMSIGHGTHVSGIIAGKSNNFTGVAPDATLGMWRVFSCNSGTSEEMIVQAALEAVDVGVDIISLSLGSTVAWPETFSGNVLSRIAVNGTKVIVAAGNDGRSGAFTVGSPSVADGVMSVSSFNNNYMLVKELKINGNTEAYAYVPGNGYPVFAHPMPDGKIVSEGDNNTASCAQSTIPKNVKGNLVLAETQGCLLPFKVGNLTEAGAIGIVFYSSNYLYEQPRAISSLQETEIPVAHIGTQTALKLLKAINESEDDDIQLTFDHKSVVRANEETGDLVSDFSSVGPTYENDLKPDIAGIGGLVYSTLPGNLGRWGTMSGTSMACPYVAGATALYLQHLGDQANTYSNMDILERFQNYAYKAPVSPNQNDLNSPLQQGAGLIQLYDSIVEPVHVSPGSISFNDTAHLHKTHTLTITNKGHNIISYEIVNSVSVSIVPYNSTSNYNFVEPAIFINTDPAKLRFSKKIIRLGPGATSDITVSIIPPRTNPDEHIMYGGYVQLKSTIAHQAKDISIPYFGIVGNQNDLSIFDEGGPFVTDVDSETTYTSKDTYIFDLEDPTTTPFFSMVLRMGTRHISTPIYNAENNKRLGYVFPFLNYVPHSLLAGRSHLTSWNGTYFETKQKIIDDIISDTPILVKPGNSYRIGFEALKIFGDPHNKADWETWDSCIFEIK